MVPGDQSLAASLLSPFTGMEIHPHACQRKGIQPTLSLTRNVMATVEILKSWVSPVHGFKKKLKEVEQLSAVESREVITCVAGHGIEGDRYYDHKEDYKGQITFFSEEVASQMEDELNVSGFDRSAMRRNVLISGIDLNSLIGKRFKLGEVIFSGSEECAPCGWMEEAVGPGAHGWLKGNGGLRCRIETTGQVKTGSQELKIL